VAGVAVLDLAPVTSTASSHPQVSVTMCRLRPLS
jgi:hypothetical protein